MTKKKLLFIATSVLFLNFQAQAVMIRDYVALRGGYASTKHQSKESYNDTNQSKLNWDGDVGNGSVAYGLKVGYLRVEAEGNLASATEKKKRFHAEDTGLNSTLEGSIQTSSIMFNSYLELPVEFPVKPYIGAGVGMAHIKARFKGRVEQAEEEKTKVSRNHFAWQVGAGLACEITPQWAVDIGYRIMDYGTISRKIKMFDGGAEPNIADVDISSKIHNIYAGVRYTF